MKGWRADPWYRKSEYMPMKHSGVKFNPFNSLLLLGDCAAKDAAWMQCNSDVVNKFNSDVTLHPGVLAKGSEPTCISDDEPAAEILAGSCYQPDTLLQECRGCKRGKRACLLQVATGQY